MDFEKGDVKIGAFVLGALLIFVATIAAVNRGRLTEQSYELKIHLPNIAGIDKGVEVIYKGYKVGAVDKVKIAYKPEFRFIVRFSVLKEIQLPVGTEVMVRNKGFGGARFLELLSKPADEGKKAVEPGEELPVVVEMDLMAKANEVMGEVQRMASDFKKAGTMDEVIHTVKHAQSAVQNLDHALGNMNALLAENRAALKATVTETQGIMARSNALLEKKDAALQQSIDGLNQTMSHMPAVMINLEEMTADLKVHPWHLVRKGSDVVPPKLTHDHPIAPAVAPSTGPAAPAP